MRKVLRRRDRESDPARAVPESLQNDRAVNRVRETVLLTETIRETVREAGTAADNPVSHDQRRGIRIIHVRREIAARHQEGVLFLRRINHDPLRSHRTVLGIHADEWRL